MGRPRKHDERVRAELLSAAGDILRREGMSGLSLRRLAADTGTTTRAIYSLFGDKRGLLSAMYDEVACTLADSHEAVSRRPDPTEELLELALAYRKAVHHHPTLYPLIFASSDELAPDETQKNLARQGFERVVEVISRGVQEGDFTGKPAERAIELHGLVHGLASLELAGMLGSTRTASRRWRSAVRALLSGFAAG